MGSDAWTHNNKEWQETYDLARRFGWIWKEATNHGGAILMCPTGECPSIRVYSTARAAESFARTSRKKIARCPHRDISDPLAEVETNLEGAEKLLLGAQALLERNNAHRQMVELLEQVSEILEDVDKRFDEASHLFDEQDDILRSVVGDVEVDPDPESLVSDSGSLLRRAKLDLADLPVAHQSVSELTVKWEQLKAWHEALRERVKHL